MRRTSVWLAAGLFAAPAMGAPITIVDTTPGSATRDGTIGVGEYVGSSVGINGGFGNVIGSGSALHIDSAATGELHIGLQRGGGNLNDRVAIYIDSVAGGFASTSGFTDTADGLRRMISGRSPNAQAVINFAPGFEADYAIAFDTGFAGLWSLSNGSHGFIKSVDLNPTGSAPAAGFEMELLLSDLGLTANSGASFKYIATYANPFDAGGDGYFRSNEFHGVAQATVAGGNPGQGTVSLNTGDFNTFVSVPEPASLGLAAAGGLMLVARRRRGVK